MADSLHKCVVCKENVQKEKFSLTCDVCVTPSPSVAEALRNLLPDVFNDISRLEENLALFVCLRCYRALGNAMRKKQEASNSIQELKNLTTHSSDTQSVKKNSNLDSNFLVIPDSASDGIQHTKQCEIVIDSPKEDNLKKRGFTPKTIGPKRIGNSGSGRKRSHTQAIDTDILQKPRNTKALKAESISKVQGVKNEKTDIFQGMQPIANPNMKGSPLAFHTRSGRTYGRNLDVKSTAVVNKNNALDEKISNTPCMTMTTHKKQLYSDTSDVPSVSKLSDNKCVTRSSKFVSRQAIEKECVLPQFHKGQGHSDIEARSSRKKKTKLDKNVSKGKAIGCKDDIKTKREQKAIRHSARGLETGKPCKNSVNENLCNNPHILNESNLQAENSFEVARKEKTKVLDEGICQGKNETTKAAVDVTECEMEGNGKTMELSKRSGKDSTLVSNENVNRDGVLVPSKPVPSELFPSTLGSKYLSCVICEEKFSVLSSILRHIRRCHDKDAKTAKTLITNHSSTSQIANLKALLHDMDIEKQENTIKHSDQLSPADLISCVDADAHDENDDDDGDAHDCDWGHSCDESSNDSNYLLEDDNLISNRSRTKVLKKQCKNRLEEIFRTKRGRLKAGKDKPWRCSLCPRRYYHKRDVKRHIVKNHKKSIKEARNLILGQSETQPKMQTELKISQVNVYELDARISVELDVCRTAKKPGESHATDNLMWQCIECEKRMITRKGILKHVHVNHNIFGPWARYHLRPVSSGKTSSDLLLKNESRLERDVLCVLCGRDYENMYIALRHLKSHHHEVTEDQESHALLRKSGGAKLIVLTVEHKVSKQICYHINNKGRIFQTSLVDTSSFKPVVTFSNLTSKKEHVNCKTNTKVNLCYENKEMCNEPKVPVTKNDSVPMDGKGYFDQNVKIAKENESVTAGTLASNNTEADHAYQTPSNNKVICTHSSLKCNVCNSSFKDKYWLIRHKRLHRCVGKWMCKKCGEVFPKNFHLLSHIASVHQLTGNEALQYMGEVDWQNTGKAEEESTVLHPQASGLSVNTEDKNGTVSNIFGISFTTDSVEKSDYARKDDGNHLLSDCNKDSISAIIVEKNILENKKEESQTVPSVIEGQVGSFEQSKKDTLNNEGILIESILRCNVCDQTFEASEDQVAHMQDYHGIVTYSCSVCSQSYLCQSLLETHIRQMHKDDKYERYHPCAVCESIFTTKKQLYVHLKQHSTSDLKCSICGNEYTTLSNLSLHMKTHNLQQNVYSCLICRKTLTSDKRSLERHIQCHFEKATGVFKCTKCSKVYSNSQSLKRHQEGHDKLICHYCNRSYESRTSLSSHMKSHIDPNGFHCTKCNKSFRSVSGYKKHMGKHSGTNTVICHLCGKTLHTASYLKTHFEVMHKDKKVKRQLKDRKCKYCGKTFVRPYQMERHLVVHTKERPFECEFCGKTFGFRTVYLTHLRKHSEYAPYVCTFCDKSFKIGKEYINHRIKMHPGVPDSVFSEKCQFCDHVFRNKRALLLHTDQVHKEYQTLEKHEAFRYSCSLCNKQFLYKISLDKHLALQHKEPETSAQIEINDDSGDSNDKLTPTNLVTEMHDNSDLEQIPTDCEFICDICNQPFVDWNELKSHLDNEHGENADIQVYIASDFEGQGTQEVAVEQQQAIQLLNSLELNLETECEVVISTDPS